MWQFSTLKLVSKKSRKLSEQTLDIGKLIDYLFNLGINSVTLWLGVMAICIGLAIVDIDTLLTRYLENVFSLLIEDEM